MAVVVHVTNFVRKSREVPVVSLPEFDCCDQQTAIQMYLAHIYLLLLHMRSSGSLLVWHVKRVLILIRWREESANEARHTLRSIV